MSEPNARPRLAIHAAALAAGILFGMGLAISGMTQPAKIRNFLDFSLIISGQWDPSLVFILAAAVIVTMASVRIGHRRRKPLFAQSFSQPRSRRLDRELVLGAVLFGVGWGTACLGPGPAIANVIATFPDMLYFLVAMMLGMTLVHLWRRRAGRTAPGVASPPQPPTGESADDR